MNLGGWVIVAAEYDDCVRRHIKPVDDLKEHTHDLLVKDTEEKSACWCGAILNEDGNYVHNAMDGREEIERGERKLS